MTRRDFIRVMPGAAMIGSSLMSVASIQTRSAANDVYQEGVEELAAGRSADALGKFEEAWRKLRNPAYLLAAGVAASDLSQLRFEVSHRFTVQQGDGIGIERSLAYFKAAHRSSPSDPNAILSHGWAIAHRGALIDAQSAIQRISNCALDGDIVLASCGLMCERAGEVHHAFEWYAKLMAHRPDFLDSAVAFRLRHDEANLFRRAVDAAKAELHDSRATSHPVGRAKLGRLYLECGELERARAILRQAVNELPSLYGAVVNLARTMCFQGDPEEALRVLEPVAAVIPASRPACYAAQIARRIGADNLERAFIRRARYLRRPLHSDHALALPRIYGVPVAVADDIVPRGLLSACREDAGSCLEVQR